MTAQAYTVYVGDCASNVCAMKADSTDSFYNVGAVYTTIKELAELVLEITDQTKINTSPRDLPCKKPHRLTSKAEQEIILSKCLCAKPHKTINGAMPIRQR